MPSERKFHRRIIIVDVISEEPLPDEMPLDNLRFEIEEGYSSGQIYFGRSLEVDAVTAAKILRKHASDSSFFRLTDDGEDVDDNFWDDP